MGVPTISTDPMTIEEFYAFADTRPDEEKWELIDGEPVLNAAPSRPHQRIVKNLVFALTLREREPGVSWEVLPGLGVRVSEINRPEPDLVILPHSNADPARRDADDIIVAFEVLSPSTADRDMRWKRKAYTTLASLTDYVVVAQDTAELVVFERKTGFSERRLRGLSAVLELPSVGISLALKEIYRDIDLADR